MAVLWSLITDVCSFSGKASLAAANHCGVCHPANSVQLVVNLDRGMKRPWRLPERPCLELKRALEYLADNLWSEPEFMKLGKPASPSRS
jgi:hypothetical protein